MDRQRGQLEVRGTCPACALYSGGVARYESLRRARKDSNLQVVRKELNTAGLSKVKRSRMSITRGGILVKLFSVLQELTRLIDNSI